GERTPDSQGGTGGGLEGGEALLRERRRLRRETARCAETRGGPDTCRRRRSGPSLRERVLSAEEVPEDRGGVALPRAHPGATDRPPPNSQGDGEGHRVHQRRDLRVPLRRIERAILLPREQYEAAGRAPRHRNDYRSGYRRAAAKGRERRRP